MKVSKKITAGEVGTAVTMKTAVTWNATPPCSLVEVYQRLIVQVDKPWSL